MTRRRAGTGSVLWHQGAWWARLPRPSRRWLGPFASPEEADRALTLALEAQAAQPDDGLTVTALGNRWIAWRKEHGYHATGREQNRWDQHVAKSSLGALPVPTVCADDVRDWLEGLRLASGAAPSKNTAKECLRLVRGAFAHAVEERILRDNPCDGVLVPARVRKKARQVRRPWLTPEAVAAIAGAPLDVEHLSAVIVAAHTGLRPEELWALTWEDVDLRGAWLHVRQAVGERRAIKPTKNGRERHVPLLAPALRALRAWRLAAPPGRRGYVWPARDGGPHATGYTSRFPTVLVHMRKGGHRIERGTVFYCLRATCGAMLLQDFWVDAGLLTQRKTMEDVSTWLGHSSIAVTEKHYAGISDRRQLARGVAHDRSMGPQDPPLKPASGDGFVNRRPRVQVSQVAPNPTPVIGQFIGHLVELADALEAARLAYLAEAAARGPYVVARATDMEQAAAGLEDAVRAIARMDAEQAEAIRWLLGGGR